MIKLNNIRLARLKAGICQHEAALKSGIAQSQISLFERDLKSPNARQMEALSRVYRQELMPMVEGQQSECQAEG